MSSEIKIFSCSSCGGYYVAVEDKDGFHHQDQCCPHSETRSGAIKKAIEYEETHVIDDDDDGSYVLALEKMLENENEEDDPDDEWVEYSVQTCYRCGGMYVMKENEDGYFYTKSCRNHRGTAAETIRNEIRRAERRKRRNPQYLEALRELLWQNE